MPFLLFFKFGNINSRLLFEMNIVNLVKIFIETLMCYMYTGLIKAYIFRLELNEYLVLVS